MLAVLENPPEVAPAPAQQTEGAPSTPTIAPVIPTVLTPSPTQVTVVKVEESAPVPMETQTIQTVQSIQTIGSNLVQVNSQISLPTQGVQRLLTRLYVPVLVLDL